MNSRQNGGVLVPLPERRVTVAVGAPSTPAANLADISRRERAAATLARLRLARGNSAAEDVAAAAAAEVQKLLAGVVWFYGARGTAEIRVEHTAPDGSHTICHVKAEIEAGRR